MEGSTATTKGKPIRATALFADLVGFSAISERMGPEQAYLIVTGCLKRLDGIARKHGGAVDKYLGDSMLAVFGYPVPLEDAASGAVDAANEMRQSVYDYNQDLGLEVPLDIQLGINTGIMVAGDIRGSLIREIDVLGDAVNVAARLKARAPLGQIYVGPETYGETSDRFEYRPLETMKLKGREERISPYELVAPRERSGRGRARSSEMALSAFVGRQDELGRLKSCLSHLAEGQGGIVTLVGEEGIGKSRLLAEFGALQELETVVLFQGQPVVAGRAQDFQLFADLLQRVEGDAPKGSIADSLAALLRKMAENHPLVLVFEDLQSIDGRSLEVLHHLLDLVVDQPVLFILSFRTPFVDTSQRLLEFVHAHHAGHHEEIHLGPLDSDESWRLITDLVGSEGLPEETRTLIEQRAGGNPRRLIMGVFLAPSLHWESDHSTERDRRTTEAERRRATILFADITGFTTMTEQVGPERAYSLVDGLLRLLDDVARRHGGTVDKHIGDCVLALFGVPEAIEDAPRAAINAAIEMRHRARDYNREHGLASPLDIHTGINTGLGIAGDISGPLIREFAVMGDPVDVASQLTDLASAGRVYVGAETYQFTRDQFEYRPLEPIRLKGREARVPSYELLSEEAQLYRAKVGSGRQVFSELVGRDEELGRLKENVARVRGGEGAIVSLIAEAGIGKSRLVAELSSTDDARAIDWHEGRSLSTGQNLSYHPFADLLRAWARITDDDDDEQAREKLEELVSTLLPDEAEEAFPFIATVQGARLPDDQQERLAKIHGEAREKRIRGSVIQLLRKSSERQPLVVVMDDLHWADQSSIELLEGLLQLVADHPILFLIVSRPGFEPTSQRIRDFVREQLPRRYTEISLNPLGPAATRRLINNLFKQGEIPRVTRTLIEEKAHGNPFYLEEVVRSLVDEGAVEYRDGSFRATDKIHSVVIPGTVQEVIMARVDRLDLRKRRILQAGSVIGLSFHHDVLAELQDDGAELDEDLRDLMDAEFLIPWDRLQGIEYAFKHPLIQEVTYDAILHSKREELHLEVARAIESRLSQDVPGIDVMLAFHYSMGRDAERAEEYLFRAGDEAARVAASSEALRFFREASKLYFQLHGEGGDPAKKALLRKNIARALFHRGQLIEAEQEFDNALECLGQRVPRSDRARVLEVVRNLPSVLVRLYLPERTRSAPPAAPVQCEVIDLMFERGQCQITTNPTRFVFDSLGMVAKLQRVDPATVPTSGRVFAGSSTIFSYSGVSFAISQRFLELARALVREDDVPGLFMFRTVNFLHHMFQGDWSEEHEIDEALIQESLQYGQLWDVITYLGTHGDKKISTGDFAVASERMEQIAKIRDQYEYDLAKSTHHALTMFLLLEQGRLEEGLVAADAYYDENPEDLLHVHALGGKAKAQALLDDRSGAEETLAKCAEIVARAGRGRGPPYQLSN